jgi:predicted Zn-dependent protease
VIRSSILTAAWGLTVGDFTGMMVVDPSTAYQIANLRFSRADEAAADEAAFEMLAQARISSSGMADFFARMEREHGSTPEWLSSHPGSLAREEAARSHALSVQIPALNDDEWQGLKSACDGKRDTVNSWRDLF